MLILKQIKDKLLNFKKGVDQNSLKSWIFIEASCWVQFCFLFISPDPELCYFDSLSCLLLTFARAVLSLYNNHSSHALSRFSIWYIIFLFLLLLSLSFYVLFLTLSLSLILFLYFSFFVSLSSSLFLSFSH